jgi:formamidopyrimidine-DNA glycosylase
MPELPELEIVKEVVGRRLIGRPIHSVTIAGRGGPIVVRELSALSMASALTGLRLVEVERRGKFLIFRFGDSPQMLVIHPKLTGRLQLCRPDEARAGPVHVVLHFQDPVEELRYVDRKRMGQLYLTTSAEAVPTFSQMGPEPLEISRDDFRQRLLGFRGEIKGILVREQFLAGIGNAYADEILWAARLNPFRKRTSLDPTEIEELYRSMTVTLRASMDRVRVEMGDQIHRKPRDFFAVHLRGGQPCPRCNTAISAITANQRITNFCRTCQPGGLIRGMG